MPELRTDWLTGRTVFVAENRAGRPNEFEDRADGVSKSADVQTDWSACPFCPGQENRTPPAVYEVSDAHGNWQLRVVPNKYPAVTAADEAIHPSAAPLGKFVEVGQTATAADQRFAAAVGVQEVFIETRRHVTELSTLSVQELSGILRAYAARLQHWRSDSRFAYGLVFKNQGQLAGASLGHLHSQLIALPAVPSLVNEELQRAEQESRTDRMCPYCRLIEQEISGRERLIFNDEGFVAFCPFASLQPYETWLLPARHLAAFEDTGSGDLDCLAKVLHRLVARVESIVPQASYNLLLRTAPWLGDCGDWFHWRIEMLPRTTSFAGLELATGILINPLAPERAASKLRSI